MSKALPKVTKRLLNLLNETSYCNIVARVQNTEWTLNDYAQNDRKTRDHLTNGECGCLGNTICAFNQFFLEASDCDFVGADCTNRATTTQVEAANSKRITKKAFLMLRANCSSSDKHAAGTCCANHVLRKRTMLDDGNMLCSFLHIWLPVVIVYLVAVLITAFFDLFLV